MRCCAHIGRSVITVSKEATAAAASAAAMAAELGPFPMAALACVQRFEGWPACLGHPRVTWLQENSRTRFTAQTERWQRLLRS
jgi:hypothetical protein